MNESLGHQAEVWTSVHLECPSVVYIIRGKVLWVG